MSKNSPDLESMFPGFDLEGNLVVTGYDDCICGVVEQFGRPPIICYDREQVIDRMVLDGMDPEDAEEFFEFNTIGAWVGDTTPCFITTRTKP